MLSVKELEQNFGLPSIILDPTGKQTPSTVQPEQASSLGSVISKDSSKGSSAGVGTVTCSSMKGRESSDSLSSCSEVLFGGVPCFGSKPPPVNAVTLAWFGSNPEEKSTSKVKSSPAIVIAKG